MKYFSIFELCESATAKRKRIFNEPPASVKYNLTLLVDNILDPLRKAYGKAITVNSGYRSPELNRAIGGSPTSSHMQGQAADITGGSKEENRKLFNLIQELGLPFDQLIDEKDCSWIHVSYRENNNRNQIFKL